MVVVEKANTRAFDRILHQRVSSCSRTHSWLQEHHCCQVMEAVAAHDIVLLCGETGCGKTTQVRDIAALPCYKTAKQNAFDASSAASLTVYRSLLYQTPSEAVLHGRARPRTRHQLLASHLKPKVYKTV